VEILKPDQSPLLAGAGRKKLYGMLPWVSVLHALMRLAVGVIGGALILASWIVGNRESGWWVVPLGGLGFVLIAMTARASKK